MSARAIETNKAKMAWMRAMTTRGSDDPETQRLKAAFEALSPVKAKSAPSPSPAASKRPIEKEVEVQIDARIETIGPAEARKYLDMMVDNRRPKRNHVSMFVNEMRNGKWIVSPQGIAFNVKNEFFDGQHRMLAIVQSGCTVRMLVLRGFPVVQKNTPTMDVLDCGASRTVADRLKLRGVYAGNPNVACGAVTGIARLVMGANCRSACKLSINQVLAMIGLFKEEMNVVSAESNRAGFQPVRNSPTVAAMVFAWRANPKATMDAIKKLDTGAGIKANSPLLELRNFFIDEKGGKRDRSSMQAKTMVCLAALHMEWTGGEKPALIHNEQQQENAVAWFLDKQKDRIEKIKALFFVGGGEGEE